MRRLSLTARLTALFTLGSAVVLLGLAGLTLVAIDRHFVELDRAVLEDKLHTIEDLGQQVRGHDELKRRLGELLHGHKDLRVQVEDGGQVVYGTPGMGLPPAWVQPSAEDYATQMSSWTQDGTTYRGLRSTLTLSGAKDRPLGVWVWLDTRHHAHFLAHLLQTLALYVVLATVLSGFLGWLAARSGLLPLRTMKARAMGITVHRLDDRMPVETVPVEMAALAETLNDMLQRLQTDFLRLSEFSSDLAHELRTPISNMLTETQVQLTQPRSLAEYQDVLASNSEELQRLARMVSDMLLLATTEHGLALPSREPIRLDEEVLALFDFYDALAEDKQICLSLQGEGAVVGDRLMVRRAISNLLSNALRHTPAQGSVVVFIEDNAEGTAVHVDNTGADIPTELQGRLFDRFYRADGARVNPASVGAGLGLSITRAIMQAHGGSATVASGDGHTRFSLVFPLSVHQGPRVVEW